MIFKNRDFLTEEEDWDKDVSQWLKKDRINIEKSKDFEKELTSIFNEVRRDNEDFLNEEYTSYFNLTYHFKKHCLGKNPEKKSRRSKVFYDFKDCSQYKDYDKFLESKISETKYIISTLCDYELVIKYLTKLFKGNTVLYFTNSCELHNEHGPYNLAIHSFSSDVTTNYFYNTIDICIRDINNKTITLYAVDANYLQDKFNNILSRSGYKGTKFLFNK